MADNITLNAGSGGATVRTLAEAGGTEWSACVVAYATTVSAGANVLQVVTASAGLPVAQQGSWTVTANAGTGTMAVSAASLPLPSGASTAAKQPALGTAGSASADVLTVQGIASMTALKVDGSGVTQPVSGTVSITTNSAVNVAQVAGTTTDTNSGNKSAGTQRVVIATDQPSLTNALLVSQSGTWSVRAQDGSGNALTSLSVGSQRSITVAVVDASGNQITSFGGAGGTASNFGSAVPSAGTAAGFSDGTNMQAARVFDADSGAGTQYVVGVNLRSSSSGGSLELGTSSNPVQVSLANTASNSTAVKVDGSAVTQPVSGTFWQTTQPVSGTFWQATQPVSGTVTANAGTNLNTSALALDTSVSGILVSQGSTTSGEKGPLIQGAVTTGSPSYTTAQTSPLSLDTSGNLRVLAAASGTFTVSGTVTANAGTNLNTSALALETGGNLATLAGAVTSSKVQTNVAQVAGTTTDTNSGNKSAGTQRIVIATDQPQLTNALKVDGSGVTQPVSGTVTVNALPAGTNLIGQVSASNETSTVYNGTTALTPAFAAIVASSSGATTIVAATGGKKIRVLRWSLSANGAVNVKWQSHVTPTDLTGLHYMTQFATAGGAYCPVGIFQTVTGEALDINLSGAVAVGGELTYVLV
jgi:hypothetical protein